GGIHAASGPAIGKDTSADSWLAVLGKHDTTPDSLLTALLKFCAPIVSTGHCPLGITAPRDGPVWYLSGAPCFRR
ncbi:hypothetical protein, partial [Xanthomonas vasicola]